MTTTTRQANKIVQGEKPSFMLDETDLSYAFVPLPPLTEFHVLVIPKHHAAKMHELPDDHLADAMALAKRLVVREKLENYNIVQNNGRIAYQSVDHVHFHVISKPDAHTGLVVDWGTAQQSEQVQEARRAEVFARLGATGRTVCELRKLNAVVREVYER